MNFRNHFTSLLHEIHQKDLDKIPSGLEELLTDKKLPFENIFKDKVRIIEPLHGGTEYDIQLYKHLSDEFDLNLPEWIGFKKADIRKNNPMKIGKILQRKHDEVAKWIANEPEGSTKEAWKTKLGELDKLLKTTNLQKQHANASKTRFFIVYSRAPIDVVRMGDFDWNTESCHRPKGAYFKCALADASLNAGVIYLIDEDGYNAVKDKLQDEEIFADDDRRVGGIKPYSRMRIRAVIDEDGNTLAVPVTKIYGIRGHTFNDDMKGQVRAWAMKQDTTAFKWDSTLMLKGGSYEDSGFDVGAVIADLWGKEISYQHDDEDENKFSGETEDEWNNAEEHFRDEFRESISETEIREILFGSDIHDEIIDTEISYTGGVENPRLIITMPQFVQDRIDEAGIKDFVVDEYIRIYPKRGQIIFVGEERELSDYYDFYGPEDGGRRDRTKLQNDVAHDLQEKVNAFCGTGTLYGLYDRDEFYVFKYALSKAILEYYKLPSFNDIPMDDMQNFVAEYANEESRLVTELIPLQDIKHPVNKTEFDYDELLDAILSNSQREFAGTANRFKKWLSHWSGVLAEHIMKKYNISDNIFEYFFPVILSTKKRFRGSNDEILLKDIVYIPAQSEYSVSFGFFLDPDGMDALVSNNDFYKVAAILDEIKDQTFEDINVDDVIQSLSAFMEREAHELAGQKKISFTEWFKQN